MSDTKPTQPCHTCGSTSWWWRQNAWAPKGEWLCGRCHPDPDRSEYGYLVEAALEMGAEVINIETNQCRGEVDNLECQLVTGATGANHQPRLPIRRLK